MFRREQGDNHPTQNGLNIGLEESQHQSLVKSTIAGQQLHQIALSPCHLFQYRARTTTPFQCAEGLRLEPVIKDKYVEYQLNHGHLGLCVEEKGVVIDQDNAFLAASVDGEVHDPSNTGYPVGNLEMKYK